MAPGPDHAAPLAGAVLLAAQEEMDAVRERMAGKEHAQFAEIKKLRVQVADLTKALEAERVDSANKVRSGAGTLLALGPRVGRSRACVGLRVCV